jgi:hypothetical protein
LICSNAIVYVPVFAAAGLGAPAVIPTTISSTMNARIAKEKERRNPTIADNCVNPQTRTLRDLAKRRHGRRPKHRTTAWLE